MPPLRPPLRCRRPPSLSTPLHGLTQRRWAQVHDVRFVATTRATHNVIDKYRAKLSAKAAAEGHSSIEQLREAYKEKIEGARRKEAAVEIPSLGGAGSTTASGPSPFSTPQPSVSSISASGSEAQAVSTGQGQRQTTSTGGKTPDSTKPRSKIKSLPEILDMPKIQDLPVPEISAIWRLRYATSPQSLSAAIPTSTYSAMESLARRCPQFVLPVPRTITPPPPSSSTAPHQPQPDSQGGKGEGEERIPGQAGAEIHFLQWTFDSATHTSTVLFTHLAEYKLRGEFAVPHTTITHHLDLASSKGIVLMQGQVAEGRGVTPEDGKWLVMCLQRFYGGWDVLGPAKSKQEGDGRELDVGIDLERVERARQRRLLLESFAAGDETFSLQRLLEEAEKMG